MSLKPITKALKEQFTKVQELFSKTTIAIYEEKLADERENLLKVDDDIDKDEILIEEIITRELFSSCDYEERFSERELRSFLVFYRISKVIENIGDRITFLVLNGSEFERPEILYKKLKSLLSLCGDVLDITGEALSTFLESDLIAIHRTVSEIEKRINAERNSLIYSVVQSFSQYDPLDAVKLILIAQKLENIGDLALSTINGLIFAKSGFDLSHPSIFAE